jgi:hypothetical protein
MMLGSSEGATSVCSERTLGAGGTTAASKAGAVRGPSEEILGAGGMTASKVIPPRD